MPSTSNPGRRFSSTCNSLQIFSAAVLPRSCRSSPAVHRTERVPELRRIVVAVDPLGNVARGFGRGRDCRVRARRSVPTTICRPRRPEPEGVAGRIPLAVSGIAVPSTRGPMRERLVQKIQGVVAIIHKINTGCIGRDRQPKQSTGSSPASIDGFHSNL